MAVRGKPSGATELAKRIESRIYRDLAELQTLLTQLESHEVPPEILIALLAHREEEVRQFAVRQVTARGDDEKLMDLLMREMLSGLVDSQQMAALVTQVAPKHVDSRIGRLATSQTSQHREAALVLLSVSPNWHAHLRTIWALLKDPVPEIRGHAVDILARDPDHPSVFLVLRDLLHTDDREVKSAAIRALAESRNPEIVEPFLALLPQEAEPERTTILKTLSALAQDPRSKIEERLLPSLADERPDVRDAAVQLLSYIPDCTRLLRAFLLEGPQLAYWLRERCEQSLLKASDRFIEPLLELIGDESEEVRVGALRLAAENGDPRFLDRMRDVFLGTDDWWIRALAANYLAEIPQPDVINCLASRIDDFDMRYGVIAALGKTRSPHALPYLLQALQDPLRGVRSCSLDALWGILDPSVIQGILQTALHDPDASIREKAISVLRAAGPAGQPALAQIAAIQGEPIEEESVVAAPITGLEMENPTLNGEPPPSW